MGDFSCYSLQVNINLFFCTVCSGSSLYIPCFSRDPLQISGILPLCHSPFGVCPVSFSCSGLPRLSFPCTQLRDSARLYLPTSCYVCPGNSLKVIKAGAFVGFSYFVSHLSRITVFCCLMFYILNSKHLFHIFVHDLVFFFQVEEKI